MRKGHWKKGLQFEAQDSESGGCKVWLEVDSRWVGKRVEDGWLGSEGWVWFLGQ